jgi:hypothetical protein
MGTRINVIITPKMVYATYVKTICFRETLTEDYTQSESAKDRARASAFGYGKYFGSCMLEEVKVEQDWTDQDVFNYLEKTNQ